MRPRREGSVLDTAPDEALPGAAAGRGRSTGETDWPLRAALGTVRALAALLALVLLAIGILVDGAALGQWATRNLAPDGHLSPGTLGQIAGLRWLILLGGVTCALIAIAAPAAIRLYL